MQPGSGMPERRESSGMVDYGGKQTQPLASRLGIVIFLTNDLPSSTRRIFPACSSMSRRESRPLLTKALADAAAAYQVAAVIPHCPECTKPCCRLDPLVLELEWKQLKALWQLDESRTAFDRRLSSGKGPEEIRAGNGRYYAHRKVCPAYDESRGSCRVYGQALKPQGCSDFPVYEDDGSVIADLRCEAVDLEALTAWIARTAGPEFRIVRSADEEFPFMVTLSVRRVSGSASRRKRPHGQGGA